MDGAIQSQAEDSAALSPPRPVVVGDIEYLYRRDPNYDRELDEIDWENLLFDDSEDSDPDACAYDSRNYATEQEADAALDALFDRCLQEVLRERAATRQDDESR